MTISKAKKKAWAAFSKYIRLRDAYKTTGTKVWALCVTCNKRYSIKTLQAGHFIPGRHNAILFDERNCHAQCYSCNIHLRGNLVKYYRYMLDTYGQDVIDSLQQNDRKIRKFKVDDLLLLEEYYKKRIKEYGT